MAVYKVQTPDGATYRIDAADDLTDDQVNTIASGVVAQHNAENTPSATVLPDSVAALARAHPVAAEVAATGLRVGGPLVGSAIGTALEPGFGTVAGGAGGAAVANPIAQELELAAGLRRQRSPGSFAGDVAIGAIPGAGIGRDLGLGASLATRAAEGAGLGLAQQSIEKGVDQRRFLTPAEAGTTAVVGGATGAALEGAGRAVRGIGNYVRGLRTPEAAATPATPEAAPTAVPRESTPSDGGVPAAPETAAPSSAQIGETPAPETTPAGFTVAPETPAPSTLPMPADRIPGIAARLAKSPEQATEIEGILQRIAPQLETQSQGRVPDTEVERFAAAITPPEGFRPGQALNNFELASLYSAAKASIAHVDELRVAAADDPTLLPQLSAAQDDNLRLLRLFGGARSEPGRGLRTLRMLKEADTGLRSGGMTGQLEIVKALKGLSQADRLKPGVNLDDLTKRVIASVDDPVSAIRILRDATTMATLERLRSAIYFNYLSRPVTQVRKFLGDMEGLTEGALEKVAAIALREPGVKAGELGKPAALGLRSGVMSGARKAFEILKDGITREDLQDPDLLFRVINGEGPIELSRGLRGFSLPGDSTASRVGRAATGSVRRGLEAITAFTRTIGEEVALHQRAYVEGDAQASAEHLIGDALSARRRELAAGIVANPSDAVRREVQLAGDRTVYQEQPGGIARWVANLERIPVAGPVLRTLFAPFIRIPANMTRRGAFKLPGVGTAIGPAEVARLSASAGLDSLGAQRLRAQIVGQTALGYAAITPLILLAAHHLMTGEPPEDAAGRARFYEEGQRPGTLTIAGHAVKMAMFGAAGVTAAAVTAAVQQFQRDGDETALTERIVKAAEAAGKTVRDISFMNGIGQIFDTGTGGLKGPGQLIGREIAGVAIPGAAQELERVMDPTVRVPTGGFSDQVAGEIEARTPGLSPRVPPRVGTFGENRAESLGATPAGRGLSVATGTGVTLPDSVRTELDRLEGSVGHSVGPSPPPPNPSFSLKVNGEKLKAALQGAQGTAYQRQMGEAHRDAVLQVLGRPDYAQLPDATKADQLTRALRKATSLVKLRTEAAIRMAIR